MEKEINRNSMMSCSISAADASEMEAKLDSGLLKGHAYGITAVKIVSCLRMWVCVCVCVCVYVCVCVCVCVCVYSVGRTVVVEIGK